MTGHAVPTENRILMSETWTITKRQLRLILLGLAMNTDDAHRAEAVGAVMDVITKDPVPDRAPA
jgi:hypothetical protein